MTFPRKRWCRYSLCAALAAASEARSRPRWCSGNVWSVEPLTNDGLFILEHEKKRACGAFFCCDCYWFWCHTESSAIKKKKTEFNSYLTWLWTPETHLDAFKTIYNCGWLIVFSSFLDFRFFFSFLSLKTVERCQHFEWVALKGIFCSPVCSWTHAMRIKSAVSTMRTTSSP